MIEAGQCLLNLDGFKAALCHLQGLTMLELKQRWMRMRQSRDLVRVRKDPADGMARDPCNDSCNDTGLGFKLL